jgi:hypothetical protein
MTVVGSNQEPLVRRPQLWWRERPAYYCPACNQTCYKVPALQTHLLGCCPDVAIPAEWQQLLEQADREQQQQQQQKHQSEPQQSEQQGRAAEEQQATWQQPQPPPQLQVHHADAAIRAWLEVVSQREDEQRKKAVSVTSGGP